MSSTNKRPRTERLAAASLPGTGALRQASKRGKAVASHTNGGRTCQPTAVPLKEGGVMDTHDVLLAHPKTSAQVADATT